MGPPCIHDFSSASPVDPPCIHDFSSASPVGSPCIHDFSSASPVDPPCIHDFSSASPVGPPCIHDFSSPSPVDLAVAVAYAHRYYRRCGSGISIFYFSICTLCCVNVTSYVCHVSYMECYLRPTVLFNLINLFILGILGSTRRLLPVAMVTTDR